MWIESSSIENCLQQYWIGKFDRDQFDQSVKNASLRDEIHLRDINFMGVIWTGVERAKLDKFKVVVYPRGCAALPRRRWLMWGTTINRNSRHIQQQNLIVLPEWSIQKLINLQITTIRYDFTELTMFDASTMTPPRCPANVRPEKISTSKRQGAKDSDILRRFRAAQSPQPWKMGRILKSLHLLFQPINSLGFPSTCPFIRIQAAMRGE